MSLIILYVTPLHDSSLKIFTANDETSKVLKRKHLNASKSEPMQDQPRKRAAAALRLCYPFFGFTLAWLTFFGPKVARRLGGF